MKSQTIVYAVFTFWGMVLASGIASHIITA